MGGGLFWEGLIGSCSVIILTRKILMLNIYNLYTLILIPLTVTVSYDAVFDDLNSFE